MFYFVLLVWLVEQKWFKSDFLQVCDWSVVITTRLSLVKKILLFEPCWFDGSWKVKYLQMLVQQLFAILLQNYSTGINFYFIIVITIWTENLFIDWSSNMNRDSDLSLTLMGGVDCAWTFFRGLFLHDKRGLEISYLFLLHYEIFFRFFSVILDDIEDGGKINPIKLHPETHHY